MGKVFLDPKGFQGQIDAFVGGNDGIKSLKYNEDDLGVRLESVEKYIGCIIQFNSTVELFGKMLDLDAKSMKLIKANWMGLDSDIATKTLGEILFGSGGN